MRLVVFYEQATGGTLVLTASASTYLMSISRNLWHQELRRRARLPHEGLAEAPEPRRPKRLGSIGRIRFRRARLRGATG
ncbi:MAG: hypothetical protein WKG07_15555 [Hymenobacter sp.]